MTYLAALPALAHWFGLKPSDIDELAPVELDEFMKTLGQCPPVGGVLMMQRKE